MELAAADALDLRLASLLLGRAGEQAQPTTTRDVTGVVTWFGALQAQDAASALWSLGARLPALTSAQVHARLEGRDAVRTWPLRGTVHLVAPRDVRWMLGLTAARVLSRSAPRRAQLGITEATAERATELLAQALAGGGRWTRAQCLAMLAGSGVGVEGQRGYHLLAYAALRAVVCIPDLTSQQTFVLLDEWAPDPWLPDRDEALGTLAVRYFRSHGPSTRRDFAGWTGLTLADAGRALGAAADQLATVLVGGQEMFLDPAVLDRRRGDVPAPDGSAPGSAPASADPDDVLALPGFDEYLLGYKDRSLMLDPSHRPFIIPGGNGVFQPTVVRGGRVIGTWRRTSAGDRVAVQVRPFVSLTPRERLRAERAWEPYGRFVGRPVDLTWA